MIRLTRHDYISEQVRLTHFYFLILEGMVFLASAVAFLGFLNGGFSGPLHSKWDMPKKTKERYQDIPEMAALFPPNMHPALEKNE